MCQKIRYWLVPVWAIGLAIAIFFLCEKLIQDDGTGPKWLIFLIFSPLYLLFIWSYIKGLKIFSLPKPSVKNFIVGVLAVVFFIPLVIYFALFAALLGDYGELEPLSGLIFILSFMLGGIIILFMFGLHPPKGKCLIMCFLPALIFEAIGIVLILISGTGFWIDNEIFITTHAMRFPSIDSRLSALTVKYFTYVPAFVLFIESSFTVYWTMKYNHEQTEKAAAPALASPEGKLSA